MHFTGTRFNTFQQGFKFEEKNGDLFDCPETDSLVHCVSADLRMGKGIAVIFKKKFGGVEELRLQGKEIKLVEFNTIRVD